MKKLFFFLFLLVGVTCVNAQQRYGFIDTEYILNKIPEYKFAQEQLDQYSLQWQKEIEAIYVEIDAMHSKYRADQVFLSPDMREKREKEIAQKEAQAQKLQQKYFGRNGDLYKKRQELVKPIQDEIYDAVKDLAKAGNYGMIVDRANGPVVIYFNAKFDLSDKVLSKMGYKN
ncbi:MAG: OmpH family outer membrane protein [Marinifilaceae bacterium]